MIDQNELDEIILQLLGKEDFIGNKKGIVLYENEHIVKFDLSNLGLTRLPAGFFQQFPELKEIDLSNNLFTKFEPGLFEGLENLLILDLSYSLDPSSFGEDEQVSLPEGIFDELPSLLSLDLSGNQLELLPDTIFAKLYNLQVLDLSYNLLALLPPSIGTLGNLEALYLVSNFLPIEFKSAYTSYLEVQEFLSPFQQEWMGTYENYLLSAEESDESVETLKKAFDNLEKL